MGKSLPENELWAEKLLSVHCFMDEKQSFFVMFCALTDDDDANAVLYG